MAEANGALNLGVFNNMNLKQIQEYNFVSLNMWCCSEVRKVVKLLSVIFPNHYIERVEAPTRKISFNRPVKMGEIEERIHNLI